MRPCFASLPARSENTSAGMAVGGNSSEAIEGTR
jgi:hypothetical protein